MTASGWGGGGWVYKMRLKLSQPSLAGVGAGAGLCKKKITVEIVATNVVAIRLPKGDLVALS